MKNMLAALTACLLLACMIVPTAAAGVESTPIEVRAKYQDDTPWISARVDENGCAVLDLPDGTRISAAGAENSGWLLVVDEITEEEALEYVRDTLGALLEISLPLHIFFLDENGGVHSVRGVTLSVLLPQKPAHPGAYALQNGQAKALPVSGGSALCFTTDGSPVCVLGSLRDAAPDAPATGEDASLGMWLALLLGAAVTAAAMAGKKRVGK